MATKIIKNQGQFFLLLKRMQRRCIGEQKKKKIRVESVGRRGVIWHASTNLYIYFVVSKKSSNFVAKMHKFKN